MALVIPVSYAYSRREMDEYITPRQMCIERWNRPMPPVRSLDLRVSCNLDGHNAPSKIDASARGYFRSLLRGKVPMKQDRQGTQQAPHQTDPVDRGYQAHNRER